jgi:hypothetical protein
MDRNSKLFKLVLEVERIREALRDQHVPEDAIQRVAVRLHPEDWRAAIQERYHGCEEQKRVCPIATGGRPPCCQFIVLGTPTLADPDAPRLP